MKLLMTKAVIALVIVQAQSTLKGSGRYLSMSVKLSCVLIKIEKVLYALSLS